MMDPVAVAGLCALLARGGSTAVAPNGLACPPAPNVSAPAAARTEGMLRLQVEAAGAREGIARVAYAEAGNQGDSGLAGVVYTILNRLQDGRWGGRVDQVLNARAQFEPVMRVGGDWRGLPRVSAAAQARIDTILNLALEGRLPDLTNGARFFQNPAIVRDRANAGAVSASLVDFGGRRPSATIGAHSFYVGAGRGGGLRPTVGAGPRPLARPRDMFVGVNRVPPANVPDLEPAPGPQAASPSGYGDPAHALFVSRAGRVQDRPD